MNHDIGKELKGYNNFLIIVVKRNTFLFPLFAGYQPKAELFGYAIKLFYRPLFNNNVTLSLHWNKKFDQLELLVNEGS